MSDKNNSSNNNLAQEMIILIAGLQDAGFYKEAESLSLKYNLFKEAQSNFLNVIDEESRKILEFAHESDYEVVPTQSGLGKVHTDTSRQLKILENLNHAPTGKHVVAMVEEALDFKKNAQNATKEESEEEEFSLSSQKYKAINDLITSYNENVTVYNQSLDTIKLEVPNLFKTPASIASSEKHLLPYYIEKSGTDKKNIEKFNKKLKYVGLDINLNEENSIKIINEYILKFASSGSKESFDTLREAISVLSPAAAKQYFHGTNNDGKVDTGWFKGKYADLLTPSQWVQKLNDYKNNNHLFNANLSSIFDGRIFAEEPSEWIRDRTYGPFVDITNLWNTPEEDAKVRQEAYSKIKLNIELSLNPENVSSAAKSIYQELLAERDALFDKIGEISKFLSEITSKFKSLNVIEKISSINDVETVLLYITIANDDNQNNYNLISSNDIKPFIDYTSLFLAQYNTIKPIIDKLLEIAYQVNPDLGSFLESKKTSVASLETILRHWKGVYEGLDENSKLATKVAKYYNNILQFYKNLKSAKSINQLSSLTSGMTKTFKISSEEDVDKLINNLHEDMEIFAKNYSSNKPTEETTNETSGVKKTNLKYNFFKKIGEAGTGEFATESGGGTGGGSGVSKGTYFNKKKVEELQKQINIISKATSDTSDKDTPPFYLKEDGIWGPKTKQMLEYILKQHKLNISLPKNQADLDKILQTLQGVKDVPTQQAILTSGAGKEIFLTDLYSLKSFQEMLERLNGGAKRNFTYKYWNEVIIILTNLLQNYEALAVNAKQRSLILLQKLGENFVNVSVNYSNMKFESLISTDETFPRELAINPANYLSSDGFGASDTQAKYPRGYGKDNSAGEAYPSLMSEDKIDINELKQKIPFDGKQIYIKNIAEITNQTNAQELIEQYGYSITLKVLQSHPDVAAVTLFANYPDPMSAYKALLEGLKRLLPLATKSFIAKLMQSDVPQGAIEKFQSDLQQILSTYITIINSALNKINRPVRRPYL